MSTIEVTIPDVFLDHEQVVAFVALVQQTTSWESIADGGSKRFVVKATGPLGAKLASAGNRLRVEGVAVHFKHSP